MKQFCIIISLIFFINSTRSKAQQNHFIYLQSEDKQPFYAKLNDNILSSSAAGYLIISKLQDGTFNVGIGLPLTEGEQIFNCIINKKDVGYIIKFSPGGRQLLNIITQKVLLASKVIEKDTFPLVVQQKGNDAFSIMLAAVVNDSTILQNDVQTDSASIKIESIADPPKQTNNLIKSVITKQLESQNKEGIEMMYVDDHITSKDTIRIFIPAEKETFTEVRKVEKNEKIPDVKDENSHDSDLVKVEIPKVQQSKKEILKKESKQPVFIETPMVNSDCKNFATEEDFLKIRKKMVAENKEDEMIKAAKKVFKTKCYTTEQVKNLSVLFLKDESKYLFFDTAYPFISDTEKFSLLEAEFKDNYYITLFRALIHK